MCLNFLLKANPLFTCSVFFLASDQLALWEEWELYIVFHQTGEEAQFSLDKCLWMTLWMSTSLEKTQIKEKLSALSLSLRSKIYFYKTKNRYFLDWGSFCKIDAKRSQYSQPNTNTGVQSGKSVFRTPSSDIVNSIKFQNLAPRN